MLALMLADGSPQHGQGADTCSSGNCTRPRYQPYATSLSCGLAKKLKWAIQLAETGSAAKCRVPSCRGGASNSKYCARCLAAAGPTLCQQYKNYITAKGRGPQDFQPHDLPILPHYALIKTAKCIGEHRACCCPAYAALSITVLAPLCLQCPSARATMSRTTMTTWWR
jgi:hypothetical protein